MARNKYPERTVERILNVSEELFATKGYNNTAMQDIIDALSGEMTKGAIYHHFKSKVDIYSSIVNNKFDGMVELYESVVLHDNMTGAEKIKTANNQCLRSKQFETIVKFMAQMQKDATVFDPTIGAFVLRIAEKKFIPVFAKLAKAGVEDGSIKFDDPLVVAEALAYNVFVWLACRLTVVSPREYEKRMRFTKGLFDVYGIELIDDQVRKEYIDNIEKLYDEIQK